MAAFKCKMCGGNLELEDGVTVVECEYCGTRQTVPSADDEKKLNLFSRANRLRFGCEFDKAAGVYESIVVDFPEEAEAYWGLILCKYGIEYVDDPRTGKKIPTCHRSSFESVMDDSNFEQALENADPIARSVYRDEAKQIEELRKSIVEVSSKEEPYDIFICYKETDERGDRTIDSEIAQDVYDALTEKGYRVFFSRITLEDKLGQEYEPYIFAALNSAKVMLAFGTDYEYYNAVWVKNEWSRFLQLIAKGEKRTLIPCYKGIDAYDMPKEFARLQAQDMGKVGAIQDLLRGIEKLLPKKETVKETVVVQQTAGPQSATVNSLLERAFMFLEEGDWNSAKEYCEKVLDIEPKNARAYLGKLMAELKANRADDLRRFKQPLDKQNNYKRAIQYADSNFVDKLKSYNADIIYYTAIESLSNTLLDYIPANYFSDDPASDPSLLRLLSDFCAEDESNENYYTSDELDILKRIGEEINGDTEYYIDLLEVDYSNTILNTSIITNLNTSIKMLEAISDNAAGAKWLGVLQNILQSTVDQKSRKESEELDNKNCYEANIAKTTDREKAKKYSNYFANAKGIISAEMFSILGLKSDGTVLAVCDDRFGKEQYNVSSWKDIIAVASGSRYFVGLMTNGRLVTTCKHPDFIKELAVHKDIVAISVSDSNTVALKSNGRVVTVNPYGSTLAFDTTGWRDIVAISSGLSHAVGLKTDGTVVTASCVGYKENGQCNVSSWKNIVSVAAGGSHTVGLKSDGTVIAVGNNENGQCNVSSWKDVVAISASSSVTIGLRADGSVLLTEYDEEVLSWEDIIAVSASASCVYGLKVDGSVVTNSESDFAKNVKNWKLFDNAESFVRRKQGLCQYCGGTFTGLFGKKCSNCGKPKDY